LSTIAVLYVVLTFAGCLDHRASAPSQTVPSTQQRAEASSTIGFASHQKLLEHYQKHGSEFGSITIDEYLRQAQVLRDQSVGGDLLKFVRTDGVVTRFDRSTGAFIAFNSDGTIRTYFKPNAGESYFLRQRNRD
jgi:pyocin large subunit-like protein